MLGFNRAREVLRFNQVVLSVTGLNGGLRKCSQVRLPGGVNGGV